MTAAPFVKFSIREDRRIRALMARLPEDCTMLVKRAMIEGGKELYDAMVQRVPESKDKFAGTLRKAIGLRISKDGLLVQVGFSRKAFPRQWKKAGWRAHWTEFGTKATPSHFTRAGIRGKKDSAPLFFRRTRPHAATPPRPFIMPALRDKAHDIIEVTRDAVEGALELAANGAGNG